MANTQQFNTEPEEYMPVFNPIEIALEETSGADLAQDNYHYWVEVVTETLGTIQFPVAPDPNGYGYFDAGEILSGFIESQISQYNSTGGFVFAQVRPIIKYAIDVYQSWNVSGVLTKDPNSEGKISTSESYAWSASFYHHDWIDQMNLASPFNIWLMNTTNGTDAEFLTNWKSPKASINDLGWHTILSDSPTQLDEYHVTTYQADGTPIDSFVIDTGVGQGITASRMLTVATAPQSLNNVSGGLISTGSQPIITSQCGYYTVQIYEGTPTAISELLTITIDEPCDRYTHYRLHFLNKLGGFDWFTFSGRSKQRRDIERKSYNRTEPNVGAGGITWRHEDNGRQDYYIKSSGMIDLSSDYIESTEEWTWLRELVESPRVYLEFTDGNGVRNLKPVRVVENNWEEKVLDIEKLFKLEITVELSNEDYSQRR